MKCKFIVNEKGRSIIFKERSIRTPAVINFAPKELPLLLMQMRFHGITDYKVEGMDETVMSKGRKNVMEKQKRVEETFLQEPVVEDFEDQEARTLLEKLAKG